ncbi:PAS domain-containing hybrid sensor histidine kinase/response regulator [Mycoplana dimorpha]|uniref:histidine kinase n=1 Tax=Mycoplana dimorpha TaxID=28320 RepID=A0A2T5B186_MYCDI|nr:PAS-domain containing protein [Mycoplana dimorpha]PTM92741.1 PAS/PAC sensor hybrid histidine kinase [Mycoplana dimorpha]
MAESRDDLLYAACERVRSQGLPAYVKGSGMRYLAVNAAYCALFGRSEQDFIGHGSEQIGELEGHEDRHEHERRCLVFGSDETALYHHVQSRSSFVITMRREHVSADLSIVVGTFAPAEEAPAERVPVQAAVAPPGDLDTDGGGTAELALASNVADGASKSAADAAAEQLLDAIGTGVAVFDRAGLLMHANRVMREFYRALVGDAADGDLDIRMVVEAVHDAEAPDDDAAGRDAWVAERLAEYELPLFERLSRTLAGGWMRMVTQRRPDGSLVVLCSDASTLKENESRVRQQGQEIGLYRALLDELPVATYVRDANQRLVFANRAFLDLAGTTAAEIVGKTPQEMFPKQGALFHAKNQRVLDAGELVEAEIDYLRPDGTTVPTISRSYRVTSADNRNYLIGSITDTTLLKRRESQLIEARRQAEAIRSDLESIVASLPVGIVVVDGNATIELVNAAFESLWDGALPNLRGQQLTALLAFKRARGEAARPQAAASDADDESWLHQVREGRLPTRELSFASGRTLIESGQAISGGRCLLTYIDITERREHEREVLETRSVLEEVGSLVKDAMAAMSQGLLIIDQDRIELANERLLWMLDVPCELLRPGAPVEDLTDHCTRRGVFGLVGEQRVEVRDFLNLLVRDKQASIVFRTSNAWLQLEARPTDHGRTVLVFSDISELKAREDELRSLVERAETADRAKSEFLANMSHEIRTPMNGVLGMAELLAKSNLDTRQKTFIDIIVKSGNALLTLINDILDFSKIDAGQMTLRRAPFNLLDAVEDVATLLASKAAEKDIELIVRAAADVPAVVLGDAGRFRQIVTNLVGNAVKFTDSGYVRIDMSADNVQDARFDLTLRVEDTGVGIPQDKLASVFEKFSQVDSSSTRRHEGTGLGLAITDGLAKLFGGVLTVESMAGQGSIFTVTLPLEIEQASRSQTAVPVNIRGARVLVVDRNEQTRSVARELLTEWGFDATAVSNAEEAMALLTAATAIDITVEAAIVDRNMRDDGGRNLIEVIREQFPGTARIAVSALGAPAQDNGLESLDIDAHLTKPIRAGLLRDAVCQVIQTARQGGVAGKRPFKRKQPEAAAASMQAVDVLVAEDNEVNQILFRQLLGGGGYSFELVANGEQAVEFFRTRKPRMILMDVSMPVMNGHEAARAIRSLEEGTGERVPIVAVTAHVLDGDREACRASDMDDYLAKPISIDRLEETVQRWLNLAGNGAERSTLH